jgi:membrane protein implicated in regulation of membrane protease activity
MADEVESSLPLGRLIIIALIVGFVLFSLAAAPTVDVGILTGFRGLLANIFNTNWYFTLRTFAGILVLGLSAFSFWLFLRIREMEQDHAEHVYPHEVEHQEVHEENTHSSSKIEKSAMDVLVARSKTAPPPVAVLRDEHEAEKPDQKVPLYVPKDLNLPERKEDESVIRGRARQEERPGQYQWQTVLRYISSPNPSDWKIAVIQADTMLDEMTYMSGLKGATLGERLRNADPGLFRTIEYAGEAHGIRNQIAHNGFEFNLTDRDARRAIKLFEEVFKEFKYI